MGQWLGTFERAAAMQSVAALTAFALLTRVPEEYRPAPHRSLRPRIPAGIWAPGLAIGFVNVHYPVVAGFLILHLARFGKAGPMAFSAYAALILVSRFFLGGLPDRIHPAITYYLGIGLMAAGLVTIALAPSGALAVCGTALLGFGFSFPWSSVASTVLRKTAEHERGSVLGVLTAFYDLFVGISSLTAGAIAGHFGYAWAFLMAAAAIGLAAIAGRYVFRDYQPKARAEETAEITVSS